MKDKEMWEKCEEWSPDQAINNFLFDSEAVPGISKTGNDQKAGGMSARRDTDDLLKFIGN